MKVKTQRRKSSRKRNPASSKKRGSRRRRRNNPAPSSMKHRRRRARRRNPDGIGDLLISGGVVAGSLLASGYVNCFAAKWIPVKWRGIASMGIGAAAIMAFGKNEKVKLAGITAVGAGGFDLLRQNFPALLTFSAEDAGYLLGSAAAQDSTVFGAVNSEIPGVLPNVFGEANSDVPGVLPNVFGVDTGTVPMGDDLAYLGVDTGTVPMGFGDEEGDGLFTRDWL